MNKRIAEYALIERIGGGGSSTVWLAEQQLPGDTRRRVALKLLPDLPEGDATARERFLSEARALTSVSGHPNIVTFLSFGIDGAAPWISMDYLPRQLTQQLSDSPADPAMVAEIVKQVAQGLVRIHAAGLIHNDLKPANILLDDYGNYRITDFGLAAEASTEHTYGLATVRYAAPEALSGEFGPVGPATDLYALGHIAYEIALGRNKHREQFPAVFDADGSARLTKWMAWHCSASATLSPLEAVLPGFPKSLSEIIARLMNKTVAFRPASAAEVLSALSDHAAPQPALNQRQTAPPILPSGPPPETMSRTVESSSMHRGSPASTARNFHNPISQQLRQKPLLAGAVGAMLLLLVGVCLYAALASDPEIRLDRRGVLSTKTGAVRIAGAVKDMPPNATLELFGEAGQLMVLDVGPQDAKFESMMTISKPSELKCDLRLLRGGKVLTHVPLTLRRIMPEAVTVAIELHPPISDAVITAHFKDKPDVVVTSTANKPVELAIVPGAFTLEIKHPKFEPYTSGPIDTGFGERNTVVAELRSLLLPVTFHVVPVSADVRILDAKDGATAVSINEYGDGKVELVPGAYRLIAEAPQFEAGAMQFEVKHGIPNELSALRLLARSAPATTKPTGWADITAQQVAKMPKADFIKFIKENVPLDSLTVKEAGENLAWVRVSGTVLDDVELEAIKHRLQPAGGRVDVSEISANHNVIARMLKEHLITAGVAGVQVDPKSGKNNGSWKLLVSYSKSPDWPTEKVREICSRFAIDAEGLIDVYSF